VIRGSRARIQFMETLPSSVHAILVTQYLKHFYVRLITLQTGATLGA
jgi:hypothetical protein